MADRQPGCLGEAVVARLARGVLSDAEEAVLFQHLADCSHCWNRYLRENPQTADYDIPGYIILEKLGRGVSSVVYKAWLLGDERRPVALKLMWPASEGQRARFEREIKVQSRLDHPNIVKCFDSGSRGGMMYYAMDLVRGQPLDRYLSEHAPTLDEKLTVFQRVCRALADAHAQRVAHRDLKPSNILVDAEGQPHILDFGLCAVESSEWSTGARKTRTRPGDVMGTVRYMSPEQAWGGLLGGAVDHRTDIWALGVMLYEIATDGDYPYLQGPTEERSAEEALLYRIRMETPKPVRMFDSEHARGLKRLIDRCLVWEKERRIRSAALLAEDLGRCLGRRPVRTKALSYRYRLHRVALGLAVRHRGVLWLGTIAAALLAISTIARVGNVRWRVQGYDYGAASNDAGVSTASRDTRDNIVIVGISDRSVDEVRKYARDNGIPGIRHDIKAWRGLHGRVMRRLAATPPRIVLWDFRFASSQPEDAELVVGVQALHDAGVPVVLASRFNEDTTPQLSPQIYQPLKDIVHVGGIYARDLEEREGEIVLVHRSKHRVHPSLALATLGALLHPDRQLLIDWPERAKQLHLSYRERGRTDSVLPQRDTVELTTPYRLNRNQPGARKGDYFGIRTFELVRPEAWEKRTVYYEDLLVASPDWLAERVGGKIVIFGDLRGSEDRNDYDRHRVKYGDDKVDGVPGAYVMADAVDGLLVNSYLQPVFPLHGLTLFVMGIVALVGCAIPVPILRIRLSHEAGFRAALLSAFLLLGLICGAVMLRTHDRSWVHLAMAGVSMSVAMAGSFWIEIARTRRRVSSAAEHASYSDVERLADSRPAPCA